MKKTDNKNADKVTNLMNDETALLETLIDPENGLSQMIEFKALKKHQLRRSLDHSLKFLEKHQLRKDLLLKILHIFMKIKRSKIST